MEKKESQPVTELLETLTGSGGLVLGMVLLASLFLLLPHAVGEYSSWARSGLNDRELTLTLPAYSEFQATEGDNVRLKIISMSGAHELLIKGVGTQAVLPGQVYTWEFKPLGVGTLIIECTNVECPYGVVHGKITVASSSIQKLFLQSIAEYWSMIPFAIVGLAFVYAARKEGLW